MENKELGSLKNLFITWSGQQPESLTMLPPSGSYRTYYRIKSSGKSYIGAWNNDLKENKAFIHISKHFKNKGLNVPEIYAENLNQDIYILQDLGDKTLLKFINQNTQKKEYTTEIIDTYKKIIEHLPAIQVEGGQGFDYSVCYPRSSFDKQSMMWDLNYFKYYFLKLARVPFNEQELEDDFQTLSNYLLTTDCNHFMYRDFQSRNIMLVDNEPYFIDYQGGRKGALQYDIASILFEAKTNLPASLRELLLDHYLESLNKYIKVARKEFMSYYYGYVYIRLMQALGAYGFRGLYEKKTLFLQSIPPAINHLEWILQHVSLPVKIPMLTKVFESMVNSDDVRKLAAGMTRVTVTINSFSYRRGIPVDDSEYGGGYVFDCRYLPNPGKYDEFRNITGCDKPVQDFLDKEEEMQDFLRSVFALVDSSIEKYLSRDFTHLMVNFGCTGGQHRSVYSAEKLSEHLSGKFVNTINIRLRHRELEMKNL